MAAERAEQIAGDEEITNPIARAWLMRYRDRATFRQIKDELNVSLGTAHNWVQKAQAAVDFALGDEAAERARDLAALDEWMAQLRAGVDAGEIPLDVGAARVLPFFARRAAMLGYDAPRKSAITIEPERPPAVPDAEFLEELRKAKEHALRMEALEAEDGLFDDEGSDR